MHDCRSPYYLVVGGVKSVDVNMELSTTPLEHGFTYEQSEWGNPIISLLDFSS